MKCSPGISNFPEEIFSLSNSVVFLYFFAPIAEECFLISFCYFEVFTQLIFKFTFKQISAPYTYIFFHNEKKLEASKKFSTRELLNKLVYLYSLFLLYSGLLFLLDSYLLLGNN